MKIGEKIKEFRRGRKITQEKLAEYLNVSPQAVSKWESGAALPDITLVPTIAAFFDISTDALFGIGAKAESDAEKEYYDKYWTLGSVGKNKQQADLMRRVLSEYPRNFRFMASLAETLFFLQEGKSDNDEIISLCNRIISDCRDNVIVTNAIYTLVKTYSYIGENNRAVKYANMLPSMKCSKESALECAFDGDERTHRIQENAFNFTDLLTDKLIRLTGPAGRFQMHTADTLTPEQQIHILQTVIDIIKLLFPDGNYLIMNGRIAHAHCHIAKVYAMQKDCDKAMEHLILAWKCGYKFDRDCGAKQDYTSILFNRLTADWKFTRHVDESESTRILRKIREWECFEFMRDNAEFKKLENRIEDFVKKR